MSLSNKHLEQGAVVAADGIPLHYGDEKAEYHAALEQAVLMDRSHEGRLISRGRDRLAVIQRISTNDVMNMGIGRGKPTILTNPTGRIIDRLMIYDRGDTALITTEPGRGQAVQHYLQRQIFFNDEMRIEDLSGQTQLFTLHGPKSIDVLKALGVEYDDTQGFAAKTLSIGNVEIILLERKALSWAQWAIIAPTPAAEAVWSAILEAGQSAGIRPAGSLTFNVLRIRAGRPGIGRELSTDFIPLEAGLWDEVSFSKGCYTGQEIIARMESRNRLAKTIVKLELEQIINAPTKLFIEGKDAGILTSSVTTPDGEHLGVGFVKPAFAEVGRVLYTADANVPVRIKELAGSQPPQL